MFHCYTAREAAALSFPNRRIESANESFHMEQSVYTSSIIPCENISQ